MSETIYAISTASTITDEDGKLQVTGSCPMWFVGGTEEDAMEWAMEQAAKKFFKSNGWAEPTISIAVMTRSN